MHAWQFEEYGHYNHVLKWCERENLSPEDDEAVIETRAVSLNFPDLLMCQGLYQVKAPLPAVLGAEGMGVVIKAGKTSRFRVGERVVGFCHGGGTFADQFIVNNNNAWTVPDFVDDSTAAALSVTYGTSYFALKLRASIQVGETLLVLGAAGGVGLAAIQLGKIFGASVLAASGSNEKLEVCKRVGADHVINYNEEDLVDSVKSITGGKGADVVYDPVGGELFEKTKKCVGWEGRLLIIGFTGGSIPQIETNRLLLKNISVVGLPWGQYLDRGLESTRLCQNHLYGLIKVGAINPLVFKTIQFSEIKEGLKLIEDRRVVGKVVSVR